MTLLPQLTNQDYKKRPDWRFLRTSSPSLLNYCFGYQNYILDIAICQTGAEVAWTVRKHYGQPPAGPILTSSWGQMTVEWSSIWIICGSSEQHSNWTVCGSSEQHSNWIVCGSREQHNNCIVCWSSEQQAVNRTIILCRVKYLLMR